jgi:ADP-ribose pyrophosphatase YjhB (NUDIX family)
MLNLCEHILPDEGQHWVSPSYLARVLEGEPQILEPEKCTAIGWFTRDEMRELPLTQTGELDIKTLDEKYPQELPDLYK